MTPPTPAPVAPPSPKAAAALEEIDTVLRDQSISQGDAAKRLVALATDATVPDQMRNDALQHAMNLLPDEGFNSLDALLKTKGTPPHFSSCSAPGKKSPSSPGICCRSIWNRIMAMTRPLGPNRCKTRWPKPNRKALRRASRSKRFAGLEESRCKRFVASRSPQVNVSQA